MKNISKVRLLTFAALMLAGAACGSVSSKKPDGGADGDSAAPGDFTLAANPGTLNLTIAGTGTAAIDLTRGTGFTDTVSLSASGAPSGVMVAFDTASLPDGTNTTNMTVTVDSTASPGTSTVTVTGTAAALTHSATVDLTLSKINVTGKVRGGAMNVTVRIAGKSAVVTDASGNFTFSDVIVPYDIYVVGGEGDIFNPAIPAVNYYKGLTRVDPVVDQPTQCCFLVFGTQSSTNTVSGSITGADANYGTQLMWGTGGTTKTVGAAVTSYSALNAAWSPSATTKSGRLFGLQVARGTLNAPTGYPGYGSTGLVMLTANTAAPNTDITLAAPAVASLTGTITQPPGFPTPSLVLHQQLDSRVEPLWNADTNDATSKILVIADGKSSFYGSSSLSGASSSFVYPGLGADTNATITMTTPATMTGPANNASSVTATTPFEFTTSVQTVFNVAFSSATAHYHVFTTGGSITIPNVSELPIPAGTAFTWSIVGYGPVTSVNAAADTAGLSVPQQAEFTGSMHFYVSTPSRSFTTQ